MELTPDALKLLTELAQEAHSAKLLTVPGDGRTAHVQIGGRREEITILPAPRGHFVGSLADLVAYAERDAAGLATVWHCHAAVVLLTNDADRRDRVTFCLEPSSELRFLTKLEAEHPWLDQKQFVRALRCELGADEAIIALFRKLDWRASTETHGDIMRNRESLGRNIEAQVSGTQEIPDSITLHVPVYDVVGEDTGEEVRCLIEFEPASARIQLLPACGELRRAIEVRQADIHRRLEKGLAERVEAGTIGIYYGQP